MLTTANDFFVFHISEMLFISDLPHQFYLSICEEPLSLALFSVRWHRVPITLLATPAAQTCPAPCLGAEEQTWLVRLLPWWIPCLCRCLVSGSCWPLLSQDTALLGDSTRISGGHFAALPLEENFIISFYSFHDLLLKLLLGLHSTSFYIYTVKIYQAFNFLYVCTTFKKILSGF